MSLKNDYLWHFSNSFGNFSVVFSRFDVCVPCALTENLLLVLVIYFLLRSVNCCFYSGKLTGDALESIKIKTLYTICQSSFFMVTKIQTVTLRGLEVVPITVEVQLTPGMPSFTIVGLPDKAVSEARERVRSALHAMSLSLPAKRLTINMAPADVLKEGTQFDLPIAIGIMAAMQAIPSDCIDNTVMMGELGLDGALRAVSGVLPAALYASEHDRTLICPSDNGAEAAWVEACQVVAAPDLLSLTNHWRRRHRATIRIRQKLLILRMSKAKRRLSGLWKSRQLAGTIF